MKTALLATGLCRSVEDLVGGFQRHGYQISYYDEAHDDPESIPACDVVLLRGWKTRFKRILRDTAQQRGIPTLVMECGYFHRGSANVVGYHQINIGGLNRLPGGNLGGSRWDKLDLSIEHGLVEPYRPYVLAGQVPNDAQHDLTSYEISQWYREKIQEISLKTSRLVVYRPHPKGTPEFVWPFTEQPKEPFEEALNRFSGVITYNSTVGCEAIRRGVPVYCDPSCHYAGLSCDVDMQHVATHEERTEYLHRLAWAQWHNTELASGEAQEFFFDQAGRWRAMIQFQKDHEPMRKRVERLTVE